MQGRFIQQNSGPNRAQKRSRRKQRGVGWTRQFSSARARRKHGRHCLGDFEHKLARIRAWQQEMIKIQEQINAANSDSETEYHVVWETDGEDVDLPETVMVPNTVENVADWLSEQHGYLVTDLWTEAHTHEEEPAFSVEIPLLEVDFDSHLDGVTAKQLISDVRDGVWDESLSELREWESEGKGRKTVLAAIDARL